MKYKYANEAKKHVQHIRDTVRTLYEKKKEDFFYDLSCFKTTVCTDAENEFPTLGNVWNRF